MVAVVGIDGSRTSWDAFWWSCGEAGRSGRRLVAVYVSNLTEANLAAGIPFANGADSYKAVQQAASETAQSLECEARRCACEHGVELTFVHTRGDPAQKLLDAAHTFGADLVVVGKSTKLFHHLAGSLGRRLLAKHDAPIVVVVP